MKLRSYLIVSVLVAFVPILIFAGGMIVLHDRQQRASVESQMIDMASALSLAIDREVAVWASALEALGSSKHLDSGNLSAFREEAARVLKTRKDWFNILLADSEGRHLLNLLRPLGSPLPSVKDYEQFQQVIKTSQPVASDLFLGRVSRKHVIGVAVPVVRDGKVRFVLASSTPLNSLQQILAEQSMPPDWIGTIIDRKGIIIASRNFPQLIGKPAMPLRDVTNGEVQEGLGRGSTKDGADVRVAFHRSEYTGWTVRLAIPVSVLEAPLRGSLLFTVAGGVLLLIVGIIIAVAFGRHIAAPLAGLSASAEALGRGETPKIVSSRIVEVNEVARALEKAAAKREQTENALRKTEIKYRDIFDNTIEGIYQSSPAGRFITANRSLARILGYSSADELAAAMTDISSQLYVDPTRRREFQQLLEETGTVHDFEIEANRKDGSRVWLSTNARAVRDDDGTVLYYEGTVEDVTERIWANEKLQRYTRRLAGVSRRLLEVQETERRHLARELHDEIGQALTALKINLQANLLAVQALPGAGSVKSRVMDNIGIVERLLQQTRDLALDLRPSILDDLGLIPAVRWYLDHRLRQVGLDAQLVIDPAEIPVPAHIGTACFRIVQEALTNIIRHARAKRIRIELHRLDGQLHVTIVDDGIGFDLQAARERPTQDQGLGLVGMEERALLAGGQIEIKSEPLKGTEVHVSFPLSPKPPFPGKAA